MRFGCKQELSVSSKTGVADALLCQKRADVGLELTEIAIARACLAAEIRPFIRPNSAL
jgi:hypothetical protein